VRADHIVVENGRATRVACTVLDEHGAPKGALTVKADLVVVAGSALRSPVLLKKSGLGGAEVGHHLAVHPGLAVYGDFDEPINMWSGVTQGYYAHVPAAAGLPDALVEVANVGPDQIFGLLARAGSGGLDNVKRMKNIAMAGTMIRDPQTGRVDVASDGDMQFSYVVTEQHLAGWRAGSKLIASAYFQAGAKRVLPGTGDPEWFTTEKAAHDAIDRMRAPEDILTPYGSHPQATCRMGTVVDKNGRAAGADNVYVMDGSIFPTTLGVNPQVTIMSLALALSRRLIA
jgi:choline dehydrogenase-like flavoprotein